jgi:hypothetical protein
MIEVTTVMKLGVEVNGHSLETHLPTTLGNLTTDVVFLLSEDFNKNRNPKLLDSKPLILQCHLFTHFNLITFHEKRFSFPSNIGTYLFFKDNIEDFEVQFNQILILFYCNI